MYYLTGKTKEPRTGADMNSIDEDIKNGSFARVYLLTGEEAYLRLQYRNKLKSKLCKPGDSLNVVSYSGKNVPVNEVIDFANTMPFLAEKRVVFLEETSLFEGSNDLLADYMKEIAETTCMIFVQEKADKRVRLYKAIQKYGRVVELKKPDDELLNRWLLAKIKQAGLSIRRSALESFMARGYADMQTMNTELEKLISYCLDRGEIGAEDVEAVCSITAEDKVFEMIEDIILDRRKEAFERYYDLLALKEPPVKILSIIGQQYLRLLTVKSLKSEGLSVSEIASKTGLRDFAVRKSLSNAAGYEKKELERILERCAFYENSVKSGKLIDVMSTELLISELLNGF